MPLLVVTFKFLNLGIDGLIELTPIHDNDGSIFWGSDFKGGYYARVVKNELFLF